MDSVESLAPSGLEVTTIFPSEKRTAADLFVDHLVAAGVDKVFGIPGGATVPLHNSLERHPAIEFILTRHEGGAAFMADCYARVSGRLGVCCATTGPGATNLMTGVAAAFMDSVPLLVVTGMNPTDTWGRGDFQECTPYAGVDTTGMFKSLCKRSEIVISEKSLQQRLRNAIATALSGRPGPVHLAVPRDLWGRHVRAEPFDLGRHLAAPQAPGRGQVEEIVQLLLTARRPLIVVGSGTSTRALTLILEVSSRFAIPVVTTPRAKGKGPDTIPDTLFGNSGIAATPLVDEFLTSNDFDVVLVVGAGLGSYATNSWDPVLVPSRTMIQVNVDPEAIGRIFPADIGVVADATLFSEMLHRSFALRSPVRWVGARAAWLARWRERAKWVWPSPGSANHGEISPVEIVRAVDEAVSETGLILADSNSILLWATHYLPERPRRRFISVWGWASMGHATAGAIGAKLAAPERDVVALVGDGCFLMNGNEVATAVDLGLPIVWVINVNRQLGMIHYELRAPATTGAATLGTYDFAALARALGAEGVVCKDPADLASQIARGLRARGPTVIQVNVDASLLPPTGRKREGAAKWKTYVDNL